MAAGSFGFPSSVTIEPLDRKRHDRSSFSCGVPTLDAYLQRQAAQDMEKHAAVVYVAVMAVHTIVGYYTLSQFSIDLVQIPDALAKLMPPYPLVPATLLGRLAVATAQRGLGVGELLLMDSLHRSLRQSENVASVGVIVDAKDENAASFYRRYGFIAIQDSPSRLFLHMRTIGQMF